MPIEREQRYALNTNKFIRAIRGGNLSMSVADIKQWYLTPAGTKPTVRVRRTEFDNAKAVWYLTIKGKPGPDNGKMETEFEISPKHAQELIQHAVYPFLHKTRYVVDWPVPGGTVLLEVDIYEDPTLTQYNCVEMEWDPDADEAQILCYKNFVNSKPFWVGDEVTDKWPSNRKLALKLDRNEGQSDDEEEASWSREKSPQKVLKKC